MSRRAVLKVVKTNYTPSAPWMVRVPPRLYRMEGARKKFFAKESVAKAYVERLAKQLGDYHSQALGLSDRKKLEAAECYRPLEGRDASLFDAVHHYPTYLDETKRSIPVTELFDQLRGRDDVMLIPHIGGRYADIVGFHDPRLEPVVEIYSDWGRFEWLLEDALRQGYRVGFVANSDGHKGRPGATRTA